MTPADLQPEHCTAHTPGHSRISTHKQDFQQNPAKLAPPSPDCGQVLNLLLAESTCPGKLPVWHPEVIQACKILTLTSEITYRLLCGLQEERPQGEQLLQPPQGQCQGRIPTSLPSNCCSLQHCCSALSLLLLLHFSEVKPHTLVILGLTHKTLCTLTNDLKISLLWCQGAFLWLREKAQLVWNAGSPLSKRKEVSNPEL